jgi:hypothetical protein
MKPKIFSQVRINDLFTLGKKTTCSRATVISDSLRACETKNFSPKSE